MCLLKRLNNWEKLEILSYEKRNRNMNPSQGDSIEVKFDERILE